MISAKIILIIVTNVSVINGRTVDSVSFERATSFESISTCNKSIRDEKRRYSQDRSQHRKDKDYAYNYKKISCKRKTVDLGKGELMNKIFSINW